MISNRTQRITALLEQAFHPTMLQVTDESEHHRGHVGAMTGKGHFKIRIAASALQQLPKITAHRLIYNALGSLMDTEIHALSIEIEQTPFEN